MRTVMNKLPLTMFVLALTPATLACNISTSDFDVRGNEALHKSTGLVWRRCPLGYQLEETVGAPRCTFEQVDQSGTMPVKASIEFGTFKNALNAVNDLNGSWRLPNEKEAISVVDYCTSSTSVLVPSVFPQLNDLANSEWYSDALMLTANATTMRLFKRSSPVFTSTEVDSGNLGKETLLYPVKTADPLPR